MGAASAAGPEQSPHQHTVIRPEMGTLPDDLLIFTI